MVGLNPSNVLVAQTSFLGDVVLATPVFGVLKRCWPSARLTVMVRPEVAPVLAGSPHVDEVWIDDKRGRDRGVGGVWRMAGRVRERRFDLALGLHKSMRTALVLALAGVPERVGFRESEGAFLYHRLARRDATRHDIERQLSICQALEISYDGASARPLLAASDDARRRMADLLRDAGAPARDGFIVIAPGSAWATKRWMAEGYAAVARELGEAGDAVVFVGAPSELEAVEQVRRLSGTGWSLAGRSDAGVLLAIIEAAAALVCNDSGPMHIAQAVGTPVVAIFGPTSPAQGFGPRFQPAVVVQEEGLTCRPCCRHGGRKCPLGTHACMRGIGPERVMAALAGVRRRAGAPESALVGTG